MLVDIQVEVADCADNYQKQNDHRGEDREADA